MSFSAALPNRSSTTHSPLEADSDQQLRAAFQVCRSKGEANIKRLAAHPKSYAYAFDGDYFKFKEGFFEIGNWTSSFFTGMALLAFETTKDPAFLMPLRDLSEVYRAKVEIHGMDTMHDLGFLYSLYSVGLFKLTGDLEQREVAIRAADELAKRYSEKGNYIQAWGRMDQPEEDYRGLAIIDCMMNLPLLFWAAAETGRLHYHGIAVRHADTTLRYFVRQDASVYHSYRFDPVTGAPVTPANYCGFAIESAWARGSAWALYGFALAARYTGEQRYLEAALKFAHTFVRALDAEWVPIWDFKLPADEPRIRDASAAAIAICGIYELLQARPEETALAQAADGLLAKLCSNDYLNTDPACPGVLKNAQVGDGAGRAKNAYTSWGDYYLMEALARKLHGVKGYW